MRSPMTTAYEGEATVRRGTLVVAWCAVVVAALVWGVANEELDIGARSAEALAGANLAGVVEVEGRDVTVSHVAEADRRGAEDLLAGVRGVRSVSIVPLASTASPTDAPAPPVSPTTVPLTTTAPAPSLVPSPLRPAPPTLPPELSASATVTARLANGALVIEGVVGSEAAAARIAAVAELIYAPFLTNDLRVDPAVGPADWVERVADGIAVLPLVGDATLTVEGDRAVISATAATDTRADQLAGAVQAALGRSVVVEPRITISGLGSPYFEGRTTPDGGVELSGVVPNDQIASAITGTLAARYGERLVVEALVVDTGVEATFSLYRLPVALQLFLPFEAWEVVIDGDAISGWLRGGASFATGSARLTAELQALLDIGAGILLRNPTLTMTIEGHTDSIGSEEANQRLSEARARAAAEYLIAAGIAPERLEALGYGESAPIADNDTNEGRARNRRVEFSLAPVSRGGS